MHFQGSEGFAVSIWRVNYNSPEPLQAAWVTWFHQPFICLLLPIKNKVDIETDFAWLCYKSAVFQSTRPERRKQATYFCLLLALLSSLWRDKEGSLSDNSCRRRASGSFTWRCSVALMGSRCSLRLLGDVFILIMFLVEPAEEQSWNATQASSSTKGFTLHHEKGKNCRHAKFMLQKCNINATFDHIQGQTWTCRHFSHCRIILSCIFTQLGLGVHTSQPFTHSIVSSWSGFQTFKAPGCSLPQNLLLTASLASNVAVVEVIAVLE